MTAFTIAKTIGSTGTFSTLQLWEDGAPADLTTAEKSAAGTFLVAAFTQGESLTFVGSGATGKFLDTDSTGAGNGTYVSYGVSTGNPAASDVVTGGTSGATCVLSSSTPTNVGCVWQGQCQNQLFTGTGVQIAVSGSSNSSTAYKHLTTATGASFRDNANAQTNALKYNSSNGAAIACTSNFDAAMTIAEGNAYISGLQFSFTGAGSTVADFAQNTIRVDFCIFENTGGGSNVCQIRSGSGIIMTNSLFVQRNSSAGQLIVYVGAVSPSFYNCTMVAPDDLATAPAEIFQSTSGGTVTVQNCGLFAGDSSKAIISGSSTFNFTTCYSDISGTTGVTQCTYSSEFQGVNDATRDYRLKAGAAELDTGTTDATNALHDIVGTLRPQGSAYDVGCWELITATTNLFAQSCM